jgi:serine/threonine-protein kinase
MDSAKPGPLHLGDTFLGKYEIRSLLGRGGHAFVYEAYDPFLDRSVALKVIKSPKDAGRDLGKRARAEAQVLSRADHKNLVKVLDAGIADGLVYLIMEKLEGRTLRDTLTDLHRLSVAEALVVGLQVAEGMEVAHREQVIHRDLKPENIFIEAGNALKVLDFGIAKVLGIGGHRPETTEKDLLQGTVLYMSPEHLQGFGVTAKSDIYALGTILFEALYAHPLAVGEKPAGLQEAAWMQIAKVPPMLDELDPAIPHHVAKLVQRAIVKMPDQRYATMRDFRQAISNALTRLKEEPQAQPHGLVLRDLSGARPRPAPNEPQAGPRDTVRAAPVLTSQVTVQAPYVHGGETEPVSKLPFSAAAHAAPTPLMAISGAHARDDHTPLIFGTVHAPSSIANSSDKHSLAVTLAASAAAHPGLGPSALKPSAPPATSVPPNTAPPVSTRLASATRGVRAPGPLLKDRGVKLAALAALIVGVVGGTAFGIVATQSDSDVRSPALEELALPSQLPAPQAAAQPVASPTVESPALPAAASPAPSVVAPAAAPASAPLAAPISPSPGTAPPARQTRAPATSSASKPAGTRSAADAELQQRLDWLDRDSTPKSTAPNAKPSATRPAQVGF